MGHVITITGQQGGSGRTSAAVNISACLALLEKRTLLVDCDPMAAASRWAGMAQTRPFNDLASVFSGKCDIVDSVQPTLLDYLDIIPSGIGLVAGADKLAGTPENLTLLRLLLSRLNPEYDFIIVDPPPSYHFLSMMALTASQSLILNLFDLSCIKRELSFLIRITRYLTQRFDISLPVSRILAARVQGEVLDTTALPAELTAMVEDLRFRRFIPEDPMIGTSRENGVPVAVHDCKTPAAEAFLAVASELSTRFNHHEAYNETDPS